jgi:glycyl-tRNA synthetase
LSFDRDKSLFYPHVIEPAVGVDRLFFAFLADAFTVDEKVDNRILLELHPAIAPFQFCVLPLIKKDTMMAVAGDVFTRITQHCRADMDITGSIGKRLVALFLIEC